MATRTILLTGLRILVVCLLFAVCFTVGGALSGLDKIVQQTVASQPAPPAKQQVPQVSENLLRSFLVFTFSKGAVLPSAPNQPPTRRVRRPALAAWHP